LKNGGGQPTDEATIFFKCETRGAWIDMRDLGAMFNDEGLLPHCSEDQEQ
jgi:hypothetical protein